MKNRIDSFFYDHIVASFELWIGKAIEWLELSGQDCCSLEDKGVERNTGDGNPDYEVSKGSNYHSCDILC